MVKGLWPPLAVGIWIRGVNLNCSILRDPIVSTIHSLEIPSRVVGLIPAVMGLLFILS